MSKYATKEELTQVAKAYCDKMGYEFVFANEYKFGFQTKEDKQFWTMDYYELAEALKQEEENNKRGN